MVIRLTPNGRSVSAAVAAISAASSSGDIAPEAITPKPPPFEMAATRWRSETQVMAPPMIASSQPRKSRPRCHKRSSRARGARGLIPGSGRVEAIGGVQAAHRQLGIFVGDQDADLDLGGRGDLEVDAVSGQP